LLRAKPDSDLQSQQTPLYFSLGAGCAHRV